MLRRIRPVAALGLTALAAGVIGSIAACEDDEPPEVLVSLPDFELVDQNARPFRLEDMRGKVWIADFVFTRCPTICPTLSLEMKRLVERFEGEEGLRFVSFSVDPENDTPEVLREHARQRYDADFERWTWVTGSTGEVSDVVVDGFKLALGEPTPTGRVDGEYDIMHSAHFVLVDRQGNVRGYYAANDAQEMEDLLDDTNALLEER